MATVAEEAAAAAIVGTGEKAEAVAAPEKVHEVKEAGAGEEEMDVAGGEAKKAEEAAAPAMVGAGEKAEAVAMPEKVDEVKEAGAGQEAMDVADGEAKKAEEGSEAKKAEEGEQGQGKGKEKKPRSRKPRSAGPHHPPYFEMIKEAIMAAGDGKAGASAIAIAKRVGERHGEALPGNYRKVLAAQLRSFAAKGRLVRVKASFRLAPAEENKALPVKKTITKKAASKKAAPARPKRAKKAGPPTAKPKPKQPKSIRARKANKASA